MWKIPLFKMSFNANKLENSGKDRGKCGFYRFWTGNSLNKKIFYNFFEICEKCDKCQFCKKKANKNVLNILTKQKIKSIFVLVKLNQGVQK